MAEHWYKNALIYCLDVRTFADGNGDGIGDFDGLRSRLHYLAGLNNDAVWLQPFFPSPLRDNGYDISDYYSVDPSLGTLGDFVECVRQARNLGIRVMVDLVVNHTSIDHPWFQAARAHPSSPYRDYYVWSPTRPPDADQGMVFEGEQRTTWSWDEQAGAYYYHRFYHHEPELNIANPAVRREIEKITGFWLQLGVSGFRVDALPFVIEMKGAPPGQREQSHECLRELRHHVQTLCGEVCLMAEANLPPEEVEDYFGQGDKIHMCFNFWANQHLFLALARGQAEPLLRAYRQLPPIPPLCQWNNFLRTHDELDLGRLSEAERQEVFEAFGPQPQMQLYGRGIRRRLAPMLGNDRRRLELAHSLMLTLPGTPVLRYGDEIGMGDDLSLEGRNSVRTPMQWSAERNGGFSTAPPRQCYLPVIAEGEYGYRTVNVERQRRDPDSLLDWLERMLRRRKEYRQFGEGACTWLDSGRPEVLAHRLEHGGRSLVLLHNLSAREVPVSLPVDAIDGCNHDILSDRYCEAPRDDRLHMQMEPYGYHWLERHERS